MHDASPWMTMHDVAVYLGFRKRDGTPNVEHCRRFLDRHRVPTSYVGRLIRVHVDEVKALVVKRTERPRRLRRA